MPTGLVEVLKEPLTAALALCLLLALIVWQGIVLVKQWWRTRGMSAGGRQSTDLERRVNDALNRIGRVESDYRRLEADLREQAAVLDRHMEESVNSLQEFARMRAIVENLQTTTRETHLLVGEVRETVAELRGMLSSSAHAMIRKDPKVPV